MSFPFPAAEHHIKWLLVSFSIFQSQKGTITVWYSNPFDLWMDSILIPSTSPEGIVFSCSVSSQYSTNAVKSDELF